MPATPETLWYVGSTTKAHVTAALAQLIDSQNFPVLSDEWRTPISSIIRDDFVLQNEWSTAHLTLEDAASHRTGFTRHDQSIQVNESEIEHVVRDTVRNMRNLPLQLEPRVEFHYCNLMYVVLTHVIETITSKWLGCTLKELIWTPLDMKSTYMDLQEALEAPEHLSTGYYWDEEKETLNPMEFVPTAPLNGAGAVISNVIDYSKWIKCLLRKDKPLSEAVHAQIRKPRSVQNPEPGLGADVTLYSLSWFRTTVHGEVAYWHSGSVGTHGALVYWFPDLDYGVVIFANYPSPVRQVLMWRLIEDKINVPKGKRYDIGKKSVFQYHASVASKLMTNRMREEAETSQRDFANATNILYPKRPKTPLPPSLQMTEFVGTYHNEGYGWLVIKQEHDTSIHGGLVLIAERKHDNAAWEFSLRLHHVSADFWTVYLIDTNQPSALLSPFYEGHFTIGASGNVTALSILLFDRVEMVYEGNVLFDRAE